MLEQIRALPKAELHLHIEGTLEPELAFELARRNGIALRFPTVEALARAYDFADLQSFLDLYYECMAVLLRPDDFADLANAYLERAAADGVRHVEMFFDPQAHTSRGVPLDDVVGGLRSAVLAAPARHGISASLIACFVRDRPVPEAMATLEGLAGHLDVIQGVGLDSAEVGNPPGAFREVFAAAEQLGLRKVAHAGEEGPPAYVWEALDVLGVERVDHGIRAVEDGALLRRLATDRVPLTVCPLSNVRLRCVESLEQHPLPRLLDAGVLVTINSDDPAYRWLRRRELPRPAAGARPGPEHAGGAGSQLARRQLRARRLISTRGRTRCSSHDARLTCRRCYANLPRKLSIN